MANILVSDVIDSAQRAFPKMTDADALKIYKSVFIEVLAHLQIEGGSDDENLTSGTREYELTYDPQIIGNIVVYYLTAAATATKLTPVTEDWMDENISEWRVTTDTGTPSRFYIGSPTSASLSTQGKQVIGLDPIPDTTTTGGYPIVRIYGTEYEEPAATSDVPQSIPLTSVLSDGIKRDYAKDRARHLYPGFKSDFEDSLAECQRLILNQIKGLDAPVIRPVWMNTRKTS